MHGLDDWLDLDMDYRNYILIEFFKFNCGDLMKFVIRPYHIMSLGGYIVEYDFPYRDLIIVNETPEEIKFEIPVFDGSYIEEYENLGLKVIPVSEHDSYLNLYKKAHAELDALKAKLD